MANLKAIGVMIFAIIACCSNVLLLERIVKESPNSTVFVTCAAYITIILQTVIFNTSLITNYSVPLSNYFIITVLFFSTNLLNNVALSFDVDMPTLLIFRSGSLLANMVVSFIAFRRTYPVSKYVSVAMVTVGIIMATLASADLRSSAPHGDFSTWLIGIAMLAYALFGSAVMGVFQEKLFAKFGKCSQEALFFSHFLGLPGFFINYREIGKSIAEFNNSAPVDIFGISIPFLWLCILGNVVVQNMCIKGIYYLLSEWSSLAITMVTTFRKFLSLLLSIYLFQNPFTLTHWCGTTLVFLGSAIFSGLLPVPGSKKKVE